MDMYVQRVWTGMELAIQFMSALAASILDIYVHLYIMDVYFFFSIHFALSSIAPANY